MPNLAKPEANRERTAEHAGHDRPTENPLLQLVAGATSGDTAPAMISVHVGVPGNIKKVALPKDRATVAEALKAASLDASGYEIRLAGDRAGTEAPLKDGQTVLLLRPVRGN